MEERNFRLNSKLPDIRRILFEENFDEDKEEEEKAFDLEMARPKYEAKLVYLS